MTHVNLNTAAQVTVETMQAEIGRHLKNSLGKDAEHASIYDWRMSLSLALRDLVVDPWFESTRRTYEAQGKRVYYLSMEFLIGRLIEDVAVNLQVEDIARDAMHNLGQDYESVVADEPDAALGRAPVGPGGMSAAGGCGGHDRQYIPGNPRPVPDHICSRGDDHVRPDPVRYQPHYQRG